jgi:cardiolipin synthase C
VRVLTNSLEATDIALVHSGYARRRVELLSGGVELFEQMRFPDTTAAGHHGADSAGSGGSSLHAKTFAVEAERVFVGSLNFDQRSANLNTELGLVIESSELANRIEAIFRSVVPQLACSVHLNEKGTVYWIKRNGDALIRYDKEPNSTWMDRCGIWFFSILPIEWLLQIRPLLSWTPLFLKMGNALDAAASRRLCVASHNCNQRRMHLPSQLLESSLYRRR